MNSRFRQDTGWLSGLRTNVSEARSLTVALTARRTIRATQLPAQPTHRACRRDWRSHLARCWTPLPGWKSCCSSLRCRVEGRCDGLEIVAAQAEIHAVELEIDAAGSETDACLVETDAAGLETDACRVEIDIACAKTVAGGSFGAADGVKMMSVPLSAVPVTSSRRAIGLFSKSAR